MVTGSLIAATSWRAMFLLEALPPVVVAICVAIWMADDPSSDRRLDPAERDWILRKRQEEIAETGAVDTVPWHTVVRSPLVWGFAVIWIMSSVGSYGTQFWVPTVVKEVTSAGILNVGLLSAIPYLLAIVLLLAVGTLSDRWRRRDVFVIGAFLIAGLALFIGPDLHGAVPKPVAIFLGASANSAVTGVIIAWLGDLTPRSHVGIAIGLVNFCGQLAGLGAPLAVGVVAGSGPASEAIYIIGVALLIGCVVTVLIYLGARRRVERVEAARA